MYHFKFGEGTRATAATGDGAACPNNVMGSITAMSVDKLHRDMHHYKWSGQLLRDANIHKLTVSCETPICSESHDGLRNSSICRIC